MNKLRIVTGLLLVCLIGLLGTAVAFGAAIEKTVAPKTAETVIRDAQFGERVSKVIPEAIKNNPSTPETGSIPTEYLKKIVAQALPPAAIEAMALSTATGVINYVRGDQATVSKIDFSPIKDRAVAAAKKDVPGMAGGQLSTFIETEFAKAGLAKGWEIPAQPLNQARQAFSWLRPIVGYGVGGIVLVLTLLFAVASSRTQIRLYWCGAALIAAGLLSAGLAWLFSSFFVQASYSSSANTPPEISALIKDALIIFSRIFSINVGVASGVLAAVGAVLIAIAFLLFKKAPTVVLADPQP